MQTLEQRFSQSYWALVHYVDTRRLRVWEDHGLTLPQLRILFQLRAHPCTTTHLLARQLGLTTATVSGLVDKLARAGLVERGQRADDRRVIPLSLSQEGAAAVGEIREGNRALLTALCTDLGPDLERVTDALRVLAASVERVSARSAAAEEFPEAAGARTAGAEQSPARGAGEEHHESS